MQYKLILIQALLSLPIAFFPVKVLIDKHTNIYSWTRKFIPREREHKTIKKTNKSHYSTRLMFTNTLGWILIVIQLCLLPNVLGPSMFIGGIITCGTIISYAYGFSLLFNFHDIYDKYSKKINNEMFLTDRIHFLLKTSKEERKLMYFYHETMQLLDYFEEKNILSSSSFSYYDTRYTPGKAGRTGKYKTLNDITKENIGVFNNEFTSEATLKAVSKLKALKNDDTMLNALKNNIELQKDYEKAVILPITNAKKRVAKIISNQQQLERSVILTKEQEKQEAIKLQTKELINS